MSPEEFMVSTKEDAPPIELSSPLADLWWDAKRDWTRAHALVDELETAVAWPSTPTCTARRVLPRTLIYWYQRVGRTYHRPTLDAEREALLDGLLSGAV